MDKIPTWEEMESSGKWDDYGSMAREFTKLHVKAALEAALRDSEHFMEGSTEEEYFKDSILNAYPDKLII